MKYKVKTSYSSSLIWRTTFKYQIKSMGWSFYSAMAISTTIALYLFFSGNRTILLPVFSIVSILAVLIFLRMFSHYFSGANREFKKMDEKTAWITFRENGISFNADSDSLKWKDLFKAWTTKEAFLFFTSKDSFIICPKADLEHELIDFIYTKLKEFRIRH